MEDKIQDFLVKWLYRENAVEYCLGRLAKIGFWPIQPTEPKKRWAIWNRLELCTILVFVLGVSPITMYQNWKGDIMITSEAAGVMFVMALVIVHIVSLLYRGERFERVIEALEEMKALGLQHREQPKELADAGKWLSTVAMVYYVGAEGIKYFSTFAMPIYCFRRREFIVRFWLPYDYKKSPQFELSITVMIVMFIYGVEVVITVNALLLSIFAETSYQLKLLSHNIVNVVSNYTESESETFSSPAEKPLSGKRVNCKTDIKHLKEPLNTKLSSVVVQNGTVDLKTTSKKAKLKKLKANNSDSDQQVPCKPCSMLPKVVMTDDGVHLKAELRFQKCVKHHQSITKLIPEIQSAFGMIIFYQFICVLCPIIIATIIVLYGEVIDEKTYFIIGLMMTAMVQQGFICYAAEKVIVESENVRDAVIGCDWYGTSEKFKRSMRIVMSRSNQPLVLNPVGIPVTLESFYGVLKLTFSFYKSLEATLDTSLQVQE